MLVLPSGSGELVVMEEFIGVSADELFSFWHETDKLTRWWPAEAVVEPFMGGDYCLSWPKLGMTLFGRVLEIEPPERLAFSWSWLEETPSEPLRVDIEFIPMRNGCRIHLSHGPYDGVNATQTDRAEHAEGWEHFLGKLKSILESPGN